MSWSPEQISEIRTKVAGAGVTSETQPFAAVAEILKVVEDMGLSPFTRRDTTKVLIEMFGEDRLDIFIKAFKRQTRKLGAEGRGLCVRLAEGETPQSEEPAVAAPKKPSAGISWSPKVVESPQKESFYSVDANLRRLAVSNSKCFGNYSEGESSCLSCPLARFCAEANLARMEEIARLLDAEEPAPEEETAPEEAYSTKIIPASPEPAPVPAPLDQAGEDAKEAVRAHRELGFDATSLRVPFDVFCSGTCDKVLPANSWVVQVSGKGTYCVKCLMA